MNKSVDFRTLCVHAGELKDTQHGGATSPIFTSTSYAFNDVELKQYPRYFNTPNQRGLCEKIAALEGAETGLIFGSGMAAVSTALLSHLSSGDVLSPLRVAATVPQKSVLLATFPCLVPTYTTL